jgi:transposase InsO family protein
VKTTLADKALPCPLDRVNRRLRADRPDQLWLSVFTYVSTWSGFVDVAFIIDAFARRIVGWRASRAADAGFVLDALDQYRCQLLDHSRHPMNHFKADLGIP